MADTAILTPDQQKGAEAFFTFLMSDATEFVLSGGAGVGKTFLMSHLCRKVMKDYEDACVMMGIEALFDELVFTATTNKAAEVLEQSLGLPVQTIHSYLGLRVFNDFKTGKQRLEKTGNFTIRHKKIVFIDESSMIDTNLHNIIRGAFKDSKIIYVGDHAQMAPVEEDISPVYLNVDPANFIFLSQAVRNADSPALMSLCAQLRQTVETGEFTNIAPVPGSIEYLNEAQMDEKLHEYFAKQQSDARILCYTNTRVEAYNAYIREIQGLPMEFVPGDVVVTANTYPITSKDILNVERELTILGIGDEIHTFGHGDLFDDQKPVQYRVITAKTTFGTTINIRVPLDKVRWLAAVKELARQKRWPEHFELKELCADLRFKAACTVYKSQGSTYKTVFIDIGNIGTSYDANQVARMLFVAASRATTKVYLFGRLPTRYRGALAA